MSRLIDVDAAETVEAIPVPWIEAFLAEHEEGLPVYNIITRMLEAWREEQNNGTNKP